MSGITAVRLSPEAKGVRKREVFDVLTNRPPLSCELVRTTKNSCRSAAPERYCCSLLIPEEIGHRQEYQQCIRDLLCKPLMTPLDIHHLPAMVHKPLGDGSMQQCATCSLAPRTDRRIPASDRGAIQQPHGLQIRKRLRLS
jgi:hypothetical protein